MSVVSVENVSKDFGSSRSPHRVVDDVSFGVNPGEMFGIVGESGSGKTTIARMMLRLQSITEGRITVSGIDVAKASREERAELTRTIQVVFQDPYSSMNGRLRIKRVLAEGIERVRPKSQVPGEVARLLDLVGLPGRYADLFPHELSGGQRQRVAIARALSMNPSVLIADEPVSALDVSMRGQVLNLLARLRDELGLTCVFISHDLGIVRQLCDRLIVMEKGRVVEAGEPEDVLTSPQHPYTARLVASIPVMPV